MLVMIFAWYTVYEKYQLPINSSLDKIVGCLALE